MGVIILLIIVFCLIIYILNNKCRRNPASSTLRCIIILLCLVCAFKGTTLRDADVYIEAFTYGEERMEIGFRYLYRFFNYFHLPVPAIFGLIALISVGLKLSYFKKYGKCFYATLLVYLCGNFIEQDLIAIRAALVSGLLLWSIEFASNKKLLMLLALSALATTLHVSGVVMFLLWPIINIKATKINFYLYLIPASYLLYFLGHGIGYLASMVNNGYVAAMYAYYTEEEGTANVFGYSLLYQCIICIYLLYVNKQRLSDKVSCQIPSFNYLKIWSVAISMYVLLSDVPVFAVRFSQLFFVVVPLIIGNISYYLPNNMKKYSRLIIISTAIIFLYSMFRNVI